MQDAQDPIDSRPHGFGTVIKMPTSHHQARVRVHVEIAAKLNFAAHQCAFPMLRDLRVENLHEQERASDLIVTLRSNPAFIKEKVWSIDRLDPRAMAPIEDRDVAIDGGFLRGLAESIRGTVSIQVTTDGSTLGETSKPIELLAYNEWGGGGFMPELLAAFSLPNDPAIDSILRDAGEILRRAGKPDKLDGYLSGRRERVWETASAIYAAIANLGLTYAMPPASFESDGQKIRMPSQIVDHRVATCLDTAMLFASAFEQAGLNPIVALSKGHALVGVWLRPDDLASIVIDEAETLRKQVDLRDLVVIETTYVTSHPAPPFSAALAKGREVIAHEYDETFAAAVDIRRARAHGITPLGLQQESVAGGGPTKSSVAHALESPPPLPDFDGTDPLDEPPDTPEGRLERWQRKLLDLTLNNRLLNHRATKTSLTIICPQPRQLVGRLAGGTRLQIVAVPEPSATAQDQEVHRRRTGEWITETYARDELAQNRILVDLPKEQLSQRAVEIYRKAQTSLQEGGANTLFLALGFLRWRKGGDKSERHLRAPLILLPVELQRKSVRSGIRMIRHTEDDPRFNTTLLEMLRKDFDLDITGLDGTLPGDKHGVDVDCVWNMVRSAVRDVPGFEVIDDVILGHFSFAKYLMWKDLVDRTDTLRQNPVVRHLTDTPHDSYSSDVDFVEPSDIDRRFKPSDLLTPLPTDASQAAAIATAHLGKDFVMFGPPGTGKSQTIANLIAHTLADRKTVLFVSAKIEALRVVHDRLQEIGLGDFCLELHSNKARKAEVLKRLGRSWDKSGHGCADACQRNAEELRGLRDRLNRVSRHLHRVHRNGLSAHYAIGVKVRSDDLTQHVTLSWPTADYHDSTALKAMREAAEHLSIQAKAIGDLSSSPFQLVAQGDWTPQWQAELVERAVSLSAAARDTRRCCAILCTAVGIDLADGTRTQFEALGELAELLADSYRQPTSYALDPDGSDSIQALQEASVRLSTYAETQKLLSCAYDPFAWRTLDGEGIGRRWKAAVAAWWPKRLFACRRIVKEMRRNGAQGKPDPARDAATLARLRMEGEAIDRLDRQLSDFRVWAAHATEPADLNSLRSLGERARRVTGSLANDQQALAELRAKIRTLLREGNDLLDPAASVARAGAEYRRALDALFVASKAFEERAGASIDDAFGASGRVLVQMREIADEIAKRKDELRDWCAWRRRRSEAIALDLLPLVSAFEAGRVSADDIPEAFEAAYCTWWSGAVIGEDEVLRTFSTPEHEAAIARFRSVDDEFQRLTALFIAALLGAGSQPGQGLVSKSSQWGIIRRELQKKRQHKPIRRLLEEAPDALTRLAPCFMMSPLSVAQYLPPGQAFDLVIFDEASQITVWDAVGAMSRARQVVVAGDPKQMPPTNFFMRSDDDPDGDVATEGDLESILDEMIASGIPERKLNLHYRSRSEDLIAFSNYHYYDSSLITFPVPCYRRGASTDRGIRLVRPDGVYARGGARHNPGEARAIVDDILTRLTHRDPAIRERSIGVVTFNTEQQTLIENLLDEARERQTEIEWAFSREVTPEPVFVKNLETVQGDERDVILFSVTYGPDQSGRVTMNFGPLNRQGGERRLNVAMTRARVEMVVYSTLDPQHIDLSRSHARAVRDLKHFLEYAEDPSRLGAEVAGTVADHESPFEAAVAKALQANGWQVHPQVGVSAYRIDLGIVHPDATGRYLAGIECDGWMYHSAAYARERDKIRQQVLEALGWTLLRIWSTDWWSNRAAALAKVDRTLCQLLEEDREARAKAEQAGADLDQHDTAPAGAARQATVESQPAGTDAVSSLNAPDGQVQLSLFDRPSPPEVRALADSESRLPDLKRGGSRNTETAAPASRKQESLKYGPRLHVVEPVPWEDVERFFETWGCVMAEQPEIRWYQESWGAVMRAGSSHLDSDHDEIVSKLQAICLLKMYLGIYQQPSLGSELDGFLSDGEPCSLSEMIDSVGIDWHDLFDIIVAEGLFEVESTWEALRDMEEHDLLERAMKERLGWEDVRDLLLQEDREDVIDIVIDGFLELDGFDLVMELIKADSDLLYGALVEHYGGNAGLFASIWHSRKPLDEVDPVELSVHSDVTEGKVATWAYVEDRMRNWY